MVDERADNVQLEVLRTSYHHLKDMYATNLDAQQAYAQRVYRLMTVQMALFAAMAFASSQVDWILRVHRGHLLSLGALFVAAAICLLSAFAQSIKCISIRGRAAPGAENLRKAIESGAIGKKSLLGIYRDLSLSILGALEKNREDSEARDGANRCVNRCTFWGMMLTGAFVAYAVIGEALTGTD